MSTKVGEIAGIFVNSIHLGYRFWGDLSCLETRRFGCFHASVLFVSHFSQRVPLLGIIRVSFIISTNSIGTLYRL